MVIAVPFIVLFVAAILLLGTKLAAVFGLFVSWATFSFPYGMIGMAAAGVALLFLLTQRERT